MIQGCLLPSDRQRSARRYHAPGFFVPETDPLGDVLSWNLHRRQLSTGQRAMVAAKMANLSNGQKTSSANLQSTPVTQSDAAIKLNVSPRLVADAKTIQRESPELAKQVEAGTITVNAAKERIKAVHPRPCRQDAPTVAPSPDHARIRGGNPKRSTPQLCAGFWGRDGARRGGGYYAGYYLSII